MMENRILDKSDEKLPSAEWNDTLQFLNIGKRGVKKGGRNWVVAVR